MGLSFFKKVPISWRVETKYSNYSTQASLREIDVSALQQGDHLERCLQLPYRFDVNMDVEVSTVLTGE